MRHFVTAALIATLPSLACSQQVGVLPVKLLDTSREVRDQQEDHRRRLDLLAETIATEMGNASLIGMDRVAGCAPETTDCLLALARDDGDDRALFIVAQKTSTLILRLFANLVDAQSGELVVSRDLNFRGDNDDSWRRAGRFLARQMRDADN